jgi:hypothetical protein
MWSGARAQLHVTIAILGIAAAIAVGTTALSVLRSAGTTPVAEPPNVSVTDTSPRISALADAQLLGAKYDLLVQESRVASKAVPAVDYAQLMALKYELLQEESRGGSPAVMHLDYAHLLSLKYALLLAKQW